MGRKKNKKGVAMTLKTQLSAARAKPVGWFLSVNYALGSVRVYIPARGFE